MPHHLENKPIYNVLMQPLSVRDCALHSVQFIKDHNCFESMLLFMVSLCNTVVITSVITNYVVVISRRVNSFNMVDEFRFSKDVYQACHSDIEKFKSIVDAVSDEDRSRFGPTTFCPPLSTGLSSPLVTAAYQGKVSILKYLLETYPFTDINAKGHYHRDDSVSGDTMVGTPLTAACHGAYSDSHATTIKYLVSKGADLNQVTEYGQSPVMLLSEKGNLHHTPFLKRMIKLLIENGADVDKIDRYGVTLLSGSFSQLALEAGAYAHNRNAEGLTPLHVAAKYGIGNTVKLLLDSGMPPYFTPAANSTHPNYVPCPPYLAAIFLHRETFMIFLERRDCHPECEANTYILFSIAVCLNFKFRRDQWRGMWNIGLILLQQPNARPVYPPLQPEYGYQAEIKTPQELDAVWGTDEFMKKGLLIQCALILERCLGPNDDVYAKHQLRLGYELIENGYYTEGERLLGLSAKARLNYYDRLNSQSDHYYADIVFNHVLDDMQQYLKATNTLRNKHHIADYPCYVNYGLKSLGYLQSLSARALSTNTIIYTYPIHQTLKLFLRWYLSESKRNLLLSTLKTFVNDYLYFPKGSTILHAATNVLEPNTKNHKEFFEAILEAGGSQVIDIVDSQGQRPLHVIPKSENIAKVLINHGAHADAVNSKGETAFPLGTFGIPSLCCTIANAIVKYSLPYQSTKLPSHIVQFIMLHDCGKVQI